MLQWLLLDCDQLNARQIGAIVRDGYLYLYYRIGEVDGRFRGQLWKPLSLGNLHTGVE